MQRDILSQLRHLLRPLSNRIANSIARAVVQVVNDGTKLQSLQLGVLDGEDVDDGERFCQYGFTSIPLTGAEAVVLFPNGDRGHPLVVAVDDRRHRPTGGEAGEVVVYNHVGASVRLTKDGDIVVTCKAGRTVTVNDGSGGAALALAGELASLKSAIAAWAPVGGDGGASLKAVFSAWSAPGTTVTRAK